MASIFFSYSHQDQKFAAALSNALKSLGHSSWIDEQQVLWGDSLIDKTQDALRNASAVVVLLSDASRNSRWVAFELGAAAAQGKKIFPVVLSADPTVVPIQLRDVVYLDATKSDAQSVASRIHSALRSEA